MKISISLPDAMLKEADAAARKLEVSRSELIRRALREFLARQRDEAVTQRLNDSYRRHPPKLDPFLQHLAFEAMKRVEWED